MTPWCSVLLVCLPFPSSGYFVFAFALVSLLSVLALNLLGILEPVESRLVDLRFQARNRYSASFPGILQNSAVPTISDKVVMVEITDECLEAYGKWPWDRKTFAELVKKLHQAQASVISFDLSFFDQDRVDPQGDL